MLKQELKTIYTLITTLDPAKTLQNPVEYKD